MPRIQGIVGMCHSKSDTDDKTHMHQQAITHEWIISGASTMGGSRSHAIHPRSLRVGGAQNANSHFLLPHRRALLVDVEPAKPRLERHRLDGVDQIERDLQMSR